jgi:hypothetical protein
MKPIEIWKKNNWRFDLRKYTREFEKKFKTKRVKNQISEAGKVYAISYRGNSEFQTDKHHVTPLIISFGRFKDDEGGIYVRGLNLLFLKTHQVLEILEDIFAFQKQKPDERATSMIKLHEKYIRIYPYLFKNFEEKRILTQEEIGCEEWGMIPLLHKHLWGTFNAVALDEAFQEENKAMKNDTKKKPKKVKENLTEEKQPTEDYYEEDLISTDTGGVAID